MKKITFVKTKQNEIRCNAINESHLQSFSIENAQKRWIGLSTIHLIPTPSSISFYSIISVIIILILVCKRMYVYCALEGV